ncbi:hypothetical protein [Aquamicrobium sp. LC103]|uniref:hypothetical protein n=1 Tax=Aquamicrobium sp. LC103 TaxID=1120658 RepID=UPI0006999547|nr:hypothetical protein [Aquamicrobium sp. LC103]TKT76744.1 hypothetical protein XW59_014855 [Aquamicrobium sp. LC103]
MSSKASNHKGRRADSKSEAGKSAPAKSDGTLAFTLTAGALGLGISLLEQERAAAANLSQDDHQNASSPDESLRAEAQPTIVGHATYDGQEIAVSMTAADPDQAAMNAGVDMAALNMPQPADVAAAETAASDAQAATPPIQQEDGGNGMPAQSSQDAAQLVAAVGTESGPAASAGGGSGSALLPDVAAPVTQVTEPVGSGSEIIDPITDIIGGNDGSDGQSGLLPGVIDVVAGEEGLLPGVIDAVAGEDGLLPGVVDIVAGEDGLLPGVVDIVAGEDGLLPGVVDAVAGENGLLPGVVDIVAGDDGLLSNVVGAVTSEEGLLPGVVDAVAGENGLLPGVVDVVAGKDGLLPNLVGSVADTAGKVGDTLVSTVSGLGNLLGGTVDALTKGISSVTDGFGADSSDQTAQPSLTTTEASVSASAGDQPDIFEAAHQALQLTEGLLGTLAPLLTFIGQPNFDAAEHPDLGNSHGSLLHGLT